MSKTDRPSPLTGAVRHRLRPSSIDKSMSRSRSALVDRRIPSGILQSKAQKMGLRPENQGASHQLCSQIGCQHQDQSSKYTHSRSQSSSGSNKKRCRGSKVNTVNQNKEPEQHRACRRKQRKRREQYRPTAHCLRHFTSSSTYASISGPSSLIRPPSHLDYPHTWTPGYRPPTQPLSNSRATDAPLTPARDGFPLNPKIETATRPPGSPPTAPQKRTTRSDLAFGCLVLLYQLHLTEEQET